MPLDHPSPPALPALSERVADALRTHGWAIATLSDVLPTTMTAAWTRTLAASWEDLPPDNYLKDRGGYRFRRHASLVQRPPAMPERVAHRAHWQPTDYNALHGGIERWFAPIDDAVVAAPAFAGLIGALGIRFAQLDAVPTWFIEAHQFRIDARNGVGKPTPEGAHRDGVDYVALMLVHREAVSGGETTVVDASGAVAWRGVLAEPGTLMLLDDRRVMHETTAIAPTGARAFRDTLVITYRSAGFMAPDAHATE